MSGLQGRTEKRVGAFKKMVIASAAITCKVGEEMERSTVQRSTVERGRALAICLTLRCRVLLPNSVEEGDTQPYPLLTL